MVNVGTGFRIANAATSRKILVGNGTNFVASTETLALPGTSGNVLTSDGTNWTSVAGGSGTVTSASIVTANGVSGTTATATTTPAHTITLGAITPTSVATPTITTASGALTVTPASGSNLNVALGSTGDFAVNTNSLYVDTSATNVGIGTSTPVSRLEVYDTVVGYAMTITNPTGGGQGLLINTSVSNGTAPVFQIDTGAGAGIFKVSTEGKVGIGTTAPAQVLDVVGRIRMGTWTADGDAAAYQDTATNSIALAASDRRLKKNIVPLTDSLDIVRQLNTYKYNDLDEKDGAKLKLGLMGQEVLSLIPELTFTFKKEGSTEEYYGVHYDKLPVLLLNAIKELNLKVQSLEKRIEILENK